MVLGVDAISSDGRIRICKTCEKQCFSHRCVPEIHSVCGYVMIVGLRFSVVDWLLKDFLPERGRMAYACSTRIPLLDLYAEYNTQPIARMYRQSNAKAS